MKNTYVRKRLCQKSPCFSATLRNVAFITSATLRNVASIIIFLCAPLWLSSTIWEVNQGGGGDFTTIQAGIDASTNSDTILVYPGIYYENINYNCKSITVGSLNLTTGDEQYISQTIIDGNFSGSCVRMEYVQNGIIHGFTIQHGSGTQPNAYDYFNGGGLYVTNSNFDITNCMITENESENSGGMSLQNSIAYLSGTIICYNHSLDHGCITLYDDSEIYFDEDNLCSVYLNTAITGNDFWINGFNNLNIVLNKFTVMEPDVHQIKMVHGEDYSFSCLQAAVEPSESDLYVAPWGDNNNSGLNENEPMQSIALALTRIEADSLHPRTIHLADGVYSTSSNDQHFPLNLKSYVSLIGASEAGTILDGDGAYGFMAAFDEEKEITLKNFTCQNGYLRENYNFIWFYENTTANIENLTIKDCTSLIGRTSAIVCTYFGGAYTLKNITIDNVMGTYVLSLSPVNSYAENIRISNTIPNSGYSPGGALSLVDDIGIPGESTIIKNLEVVNNINNEDEWNTSSSVCVVYYADVIFINATIASNNNRPGYGAAITLDSGKLTLINSIVYGNYPHQIRLDSNS
ncbi:MAG TPA: hypothetical protein PLD62_08550, partial [Candidatus Cloacimonadota bacterium]|nr:hypothetical protein [Candidatus Cloacimonadota bacterium]